MYRFARLAAAVACAVLPLSAHAVAISTLAEGTSPTETVSDPQGPAVSGTVTSVATLSDGANIDFSGAAEARATQRADGVAAVRADGAFANGQLGNSLLARSSWSDTVTNTSGGAQQFAYDFFILPGATLQIVDFAGLPDAGSNQVEVSYSIEVMLNGVTPIFGSSASLMGGRRSLVLTETGTSLVATALPSSGRGYTFGGFTGSLALGSFAAGESFTVETVMQVNVATPGFEAGGLAFIGDPLDISGTPGAGGSIVPVPEPGPAALLLATATFVAIARRRAASSPCRAGSAE